MALLLTEEKDFKKWLEDCIEDDEKEIKEVGEVIERKKNVLKTTSHPKSIEFIQISIEMCEEEAKYYKQTVARQRKRYKHRYGYEYEAKPALPMRGVTNKQTATKIDDFLSGEFRTFMKKERGGADHHDNT